MRMKWDAMEGDLYYGSMFADPPFWCRLERKAERNMHSLMGNSNAEHWCRSRAQSAPTRRKVPHVSWLNLLTLSFFNRFGITNVSPWKLSITRKKKTFERLDQRKIFRLTASCRGIVPSTGSSTSSTLCGWHKISDNFFSFLMKHIVGEFRFVF